MITGTVYILFGIFEDGQRHLLAVSTERQEVVELAVTPRATCGGEIFVALIVESFGGIEYVEQVRKRHQDKKESEAKQATDDLLAQVLKAVKS